ncbi:MAG: hypothetical protein Q4P78_09340, partial [Rothia sp. (in: high G+C Gram-positive bacteria)]|uniref:hypothetical protein n=1 Tax=Rothia sp. (in: high G+C Gram-positive bacteria) TaxID=1885016 RepID=UPI0026DEE878
LLPLLSACSSKKFLQTDEYLLSEVSIVSTNPNFKPTGYRNYVRQQPNSKWFSWLKVPLGVYCLSKADSVKGNKGFSRILRNIGEAPVVYDPQLTRYSTYNLQQALASNGYLRGTVDTLVTRKGHKATVQYRLTPGMRYYVRSLQYSFDNANIARLVTADSTAYLLRRGMPLNLGKLSEERSRIVHTLRNRGYYYLNNDFITYDIDTIAGDLGVAVRLRFALPPGADSLRAYVPQRYGRVRIIEERETGETEATDSTHYRGWDFHYHGTEHIRKRVFINHVSLEPDSLYHETKVQNTYGTLNALPIINYTSVKLTPVKDSTDLLDCDIRVKRNQLHTLGMDLEGTNTAGDLGAAVALT